MTSVAGVDVDGTGVTAGEGGILVMVRCACLGQGRRRLPVDKGLILPETGPAPNCPAAPRIPLARRQKF